MSNIMELLPREKSISGSCSLGEGGGGTPVQGEGGLWWGASSSPARDRDGKGLSCLSPGRWIRDILLPTFISLMIWSDGIHTKLLWETLSSRTERSNQDLVMFSNWSNYGFLLNKSKDWYQSSDALPLHFFCILRRRQGKPPLTKSDEFSEKLQMAFAPLHPPFSENHIADFWGHVNVWIFVQ